MISVGGPVSAWPKRTISRVIIRKEILFKAITDAQKYEWKKNFKFDGLTDVEFK